MDRSRLLAALAPVALLSFTLAGCGGAATTQEPASPRVAPAARAAQTESARAAEDFGDLSAEVCQTWADHFGKRVREATARRIDECAAKCAAAGRTSKTDAVDRANADAEADRLRETIIEQCSAQAGAKFVRSDAACFLASKTMEGWRECEFKSMFFSDYKALAKNHQTLFDRRCDAVLRGG
jgi:hypothetical protein